MGSIMEWIFPERYERKARAQEGRQAMAEAQERFAATLAKHLDFARKPGRRSRVDGQTRGRRHDDDLE